MSATSASGEELCPGSALQEQECRYLDEALRLKREPPRDGDSPPTASPPRDFCGLALSGGGMRSATFNLGLLQGLQQLGLLEMFDYLATVSGGGYVGGFWTAWRHYHAPGAPAGDDRPRLFPMNEQGSRGAHLGEVRHLREFSNFLIPRLGLLSLDTGRIIVAALSATLPALLAALSFITLAFLLWVLLARFLLIGWPPGAPPPVGLPVSYALMLVMTCGGLWFREWLLTRQERQVLRARRERGEGSRLDTPDSPPEALRKFETRKFGYYLPATLLATALVFLLWRWLLHPEGPRPREPLHVFTPAAAWLGTAGALVLLKWLGSRFMTEGMQRTELAAVERVLSRLLLLAALWSGFAAFWLTGRLLREYILAHPSPRDAYAALQTGLVGAVVALTALFARMQQLFGRRTSKPISSNVRNRAKSRLPQVVAYVTLSLIALGMVLLILGAEARGWLAPLAAGAVAITLLTLFFFDTNLMGLHAFYRARIARTFLGAAHGKAPGQTEPHPQDDLLLDWLKPRPGPLHLICCAANDLSSEDPMAGLYRGADSAVLSSVGFTVGGEGKTWEEIRHAGGDVPTLAAAMTASGAAFNSHMGSMSMRLGQAVTFLMTAFNLRLGLWLPHPTRARRRWYERMCVGLPFYKELLGRSRARSRHVLLSDGGHFENVALYELVRRHCRFILVSDCGMDLDTAFDDFANAVRRIREDFGVEIRVDLSPLRAGQDGLSCQPIVVGDIDYPDGDTGVLLVLKPTLMGNEPPDITQYKARSATFPHESTGDQFYDEAQWEAYRRLGEHAALTAFRPLRQDTAPWSPHMAARLFARARDEWLPAPSGYAERYSRFVARAAELDSLLQQREAQRLFHEVFNEVTELDAQARAGGRSPTARYSPPPRELAKALHLVRLALLFMEEVFLSENLSTRYNHPAYLGLMNYFARWAYSGPFRAWWPLMKTQFSQRFTHFLERHFNLPSIERSGLGRLSTVRGFAMSCWTRQGGRLPREEKRDGRPPIERLISYQLAMPCEGTPRYYIQAAQLIVRIRHQDGRPLRWNPDGGGSRQMVVWQADDFYVPPGLWGAGIREDFLRMLISSKELIDRKYLARGDLLAVRILVDREASAAECKQWVDDMQLYRSHGFEEPGPEQKPYLAEIGNELDENPALPRHEQEGEHWRPYWLTRIFSPAILSS